MREFPLFVAVILAGCGGDGVSLAPASPPDQPAPQPVQHAPEITNLSLSPNIVTYLDGNGSVPVAAQFDFTDVGLDIQNLRIEISDGTSLTIEPTEPITSASGTITEEFNVSTNEVGHFTVEIWLVDRAGGASNHLTAVVSIQSPVPEITMLKPSVVRAGSSGISLSVTGTDFLAGATVTWDGADRTTEYLSDTEVVASISATNLAAPDTVSVRVRNPDPTAGTSNALSFVIVSDVQSSEWTKRLGGLPYALNDVIWNGSVFIAVGNNGAILTSADGIDWLAIETPTDANLFAVSFHGSDIVAVGDDATVLLSIDDGTSWVTKHSADWAVALEAVAVNETLIVAGGYSYGLAADFILVSEDGGDTWTTPLPFGGGSGYWFTDLVYNNGLYVAATRNLYTVNNCQGRPIGAAVVRVSGDGEVWDEILLRDEPATSYSVLHDGGRFIAVGSDSTVFTSADGFNWTALLTPVQEIDYLSAAWNGSKLVAAGRISWCYWMDGSTPAFERPIGISSNDGGLTWEVFTIDGHYESRGMTWGNGRFVSVGQSTPVSDEGAIYSTG